MNVHRLRAVDEIPPRFAVPPAEGEPENYQPPRRLWLQILGLRRWTITWIVVAAMAVAAGYVLRMPSVYTASTSILINLPPGKADPGTREAIATVENQAQILTSAPFAERVIKKLNLERDDEFTGGHQSTGLFGMLLSLAGLRDRPAAIGLPHGAVDPIILKRFASKLSVEIQGRSTVVRISFSAGAPTKAASIANAIAGLYLGDQPMTQQPAAADGHVDQLGAQARADQQALAQYKAANPFGDAAPVQQAEQPSDLSQQLASARTKAAAEEAKFRQLNTLYHSGGVDAVAPKLASSALAQLRTRQADLARQEAELSTKYGERHPQMIALKTDQAAVAKKIDDEVRRLIQNQGGQLNAARARVAALEQNQTTAVPARAPSLSDDRLRDLEQRAAASRAAYQAAVADGQARPAAQTQVPQARQIDPAATPRTPASPNRLMILGGTFGASLLLAMLLALWLERPKNAFRSGREIEAMARVANFAVVPSTSGGKGAVERVVRKPRSSYAEGIRSIYAGLQLLRGGLPKVLLVTSSIPDEGKTSIAVALGRLVARGGGRVILVDCDLRHPSVARHFAGQKTEAGLADVLTGNCDLATILRRDPLSPLEFLPVAGPAANCAELLSSQALKNLIEVLRLHYDLVILDAAPVLPVADTRLLSRLADKAIYVVEWNKTPREAVLSGIAMLRNAGTDVAGTLLNKADMRRHAIYGYGFAGRNHGYGGRYYAE